MTAADSDDPSAASSCKCNYLLDLFGSFWLYVEFWSTPKCSCPCAVLVGCGCAERDGGVGLLQLFFYS